MNQHLSDEEYQAVYSKVPRLNVELVIMERGKVLLSKRVIEPWQGHWHLPGGRVLMNETLEEAVARIGRLELGLEVKAVDVLGSITYPSIKGQPKDFEWPIGVVYSADVLKGEIKGWELAPRVEWFSELPRPIIEEQKTFLLDRALF